MCLNVCFPSWSLNPAVFFPLQPEGLLRYHCPTTVSSIESRTVCLKWDSWGSSQDTALGFPFFWFSQMLISNAIPCTYVWLNVCVDLCHHSCFFISIFYIMNHSSSEYDSFSVMQYLSHIQLIFTRQMSSISQRGAGMWGPFLKGYNLKALHFLLLAFTRPMLTVGLHPICDIPEGHVS